MNKLLIQDLIKLSGKSLRAICREADVDPSNLSGYLKREDRYISGEILDRLMLVLGVRSGELVVNKVHHWTTDRDLVSLQRVINLLLKRVVIFPVARHRNSLMKSARDLPITILKSINDVYVIVTLSPKLLKEIKSVRNLPYISPRYLENAEWWRVQKNEKASPEQINLSDQAYDALKNNELSLEMLQKITSGASLTSWADVIALADKMALSAEDVYSLIIEKG